MGRVSGTEFLVEELGCKVDILQSNYLGMPLGVHYMFESVWDG